MKRPPTRPGACATLVLTEMVVALALIAVPGAAHAAIHPMTRERLAEAELAGRAATREGAIIHAGTCRTRARHGIHMFDVRIMTPFASVAFAVFESRKKGAPLDLSTWPLEEADRQSVIVSVDPAALFPAGLPPAPPLSVDRVLLRRGDQTIEPRRADTHEVLFPDFDEKHRRYRGGAYYFPLEPFAPEAGDLEIVVIPQAPGPGAEAVLRLNRRQLARLT